MTLWIGVASCEVNPTVGTPLGGYPVGHRVSTGVHDDLQALALSVRDDVGGDHFVLVCFDGISVPAEMLARIHLDADVQVVPVASHTHAAPSLQAWDQGVMGDYSHEYQSRLVAICQQMALDAIANQQPGYLALGTGGLSEPVGTNRRSPDAHRDDKVRVVEARTADDIALATFVLHGCHPTVLNAENTLVSADLIDGLRTRLAATLPGVPIAYLPGGAGDQSTRHTRRGSTFGEATRLGEILGDAVLDARADMTRVERSLVRSARFGLESRPTPPLKMAERQWSYWSAESVRRLRNGEDPAAQRQAEVELIGASHDLRRARDGSRLSAIIDVSVTLWNLQAISIAFWPVEPTIELAHALEAEDQTWLCGYASGYFGYLLGAEDCERGGYEVAASALRCSAATQFIKHTRSLAAEFDSPDSTTNDRKGDR